MWVSRGAMVNHKMLRIKLYGRTFKTIRAQNHKGFENKTQLLKKACHRGKPFVF